MGKTSNRLIRLTYLRHHIYRRILPLLRKRYGYGDGKPKSKLSKSSSH